MERVLRLTNTLTRRMEDIRPGSPDGILRMYHCGPTVYGTPHLGNLRRFIAADLLVRVARFLGYRVRSVMNLTDVGHLLDPASPRRDFGPPGAGAVHDEVVGQDRMVVAAQREKLSPSAVAAKYTAEFFAALVALRAEPADYYPRATMHIPGMQELIRRLLKRRHAYVTASGVYFDTASFPAYGALSGNTRDALAAGERVAVREEKKHPSDFVLWIRAPAEHLLQWDSPWGKGYPGWHLECSAMAMQVLGEQVDIHTGGKDNLFPHHENEIAQSEGATGKAFVRTWVHNEHLVLEDGDKMAKSEGAVLTLADVKARGHDPLAFRLLCLQTHYRSSLRFSWEALGAAAEGLRTLRAFVARLRDREGEVGTERGEHHGAADHKARVAALEHDFTEALADDLGAPQALASLFRCVREVNPELEAGRLDAEAAAVLRATLRKLDTVLAVLDVDAPLPSPAVPAEVQRLVQQREEARRRQDFVTADRLRREIADKGFRIEDTPRGPRVSDLPRQ